MGTNDKNISNSPGHAGGKMKKEKPTLKDLEKHFQFVHGVDKCEKVLAQAASLTSDSSTRLICALFVVPVS